MKKIFVSYGNEPYYKSLDRIKKEVEETGLFDEILIYTDKDLPEDIKNNILYSYKRGGGYWIWKPWVVLQALKHAQKDDIIVYSDCGNTIYKHKAWLKYFHMMRKYDALFFYNGGSLEKWTRNSVFEYFGKELHKNFYQIISSFFLVTSNARDFIQEWYNSMFFHPELVMDVSKERLELESPKFVEHRHDQAVLSGVAYTYPDKDKVGILPEKSERLRSFGQPIYNSRISDDKRRSPEMPSPLSAIFIADYMLKPYRRLKTWILRYII